MIRRDTAIGDAARRCASLLCALSMTVGAPSVLAQADIAAEQVSRATTASIMAATVEALPSCLAWRIAGICFFLRCTPYGCSVETSIRVQHYVPDVIVSTYNEGRNHPWVDVGTIVASAFERVGSSMMGLQLPLDSSANTARAAQEVVTFKSADAIGNPVGAIMAGGGSFEFLGFGELMDFPSRELPRIIRLWAGVPVQAGNLLLEGARASALNAGSLVSQIAALPGQFGGMVSSAGGLLQSVLPSSMGNGSSSGGGGGGGGSSNGGMPALDQMNQMFSQLGVPGGMSGQGGGGSNPYLCPGVAGLFSVFYHSDPDAVFWRGKLPLDLLYPSAWIPGFDEVTRQFTTTWGNIYPRTGELVQAHPVKASAVFAERVASIISQPYQPHVYKRLTAKGEGSYVYFERGIHPLWQPVWPAPSPGCIQFGENDSLSPSSYGDFRTSALYGYVWNYWRRYSCCERRTPIFLFTIP